MPLVSLIELENSLKMNQFINQHHPQFNQHQAQHQHHHHSQQQHHAGHLAHHINGASSSPGFYNHSNSSPASSSTYANNMNALNPANLAMGNSNQSSNGPNNLIANEILNQIQNFNAINLNSKLLTNITNNLMMNGIKSSAASSILSGINLNALSQSIQNKQVNYSRYKTELCRQFSENGECKYGDKCQFAHGFNDLKDVNRHPKYKTDFCKTFHSKGFCPYGPRCHFIHDLSEKFDMSILNVASSGSPQTSASQAAHDSMIISKYLNGLNNKSAQQAVSADFAKENMVDKELEAIQMQLTSSLFSNANEDFHEEAQGADDKSKTSNMERDALKNDSSKGTFGNGVEVKSDKEHILTPQTSMDELEVSLTQSLSLLSYAQSPSMSSSSTSSSNCISSAASSHVSSSGSSKSSSPVSSSSNNIIGDTNAAYMSHKSSSEPILGAIHGNQLFSGSADITKNDPLSILLLSPSQSPSSSASSSSSSARSSASSSNENVFQSSNNLYFNNPLNEINMMNKARLQSPIKPLQPTMTTTITKPNGVGFKNAHSFDKWTSIGGESDSSLLAINNQNLDQAGLSPSMIQFLRQHCSNNQQQPANVIKRPPSTIGQESLLGMTPISAPIGSHLSKPSTQSGKIDNNNLSSYFNMNSSNTNQNKMIGLQSQQQQTLNPSTAKFNINW